MKKKKDASDGSAPTGGNPPAKNGPKKKSKEEAPRYKNWEKDRRDRLNVAFSKLATTISGSTPPIKKIDIIIKACDCITRLRTDLEKLKQDSGVDNSVLEDEALRFKKQIEELQQRMDRLVKLLMECGGEKPAWVSLPPTTPAPPDLGKRPLHYSNKLDAARVKELLHLPKKTIIKRIQNSKKKKKDEVKRKVGVPKVPCTMINQLPPGILLFKNPPANSPKVLIVPPPHPQPVAAPLILLQPQPMPAKPQLIAAKPPLGKLNISSLNHRQIRAKKIKKALALQNSKGIRHSIDALCKKSKEAAAPNTSPVKGQTVISSQNAESQTEFHLLTSENHNEQNLMNPKVSIASAVPVGKENISSQNSAIQPIIRPPSPKSKTLSATSATQSVSKAAVTSMSAPMKETFTHLKPDSVSMPPQVSSSNLSTLKLAHSVASTISADPQTNSVCVFSNQEKAPQAVFSHTSQAPIISFTENYSFSSSRNYDTQTTFSHLTTVQTPHFHAPLIPANSKDHEQPIFTHEHRKSTPFTHETPMQINAAIVSSAASSQTPASQTDTFSHLRTNILPTFSTFGDLSGSHCNQFTTPVSTQQQLKSSQGSFNNSEILSHMPQKQNNFQDQSKSAAPTFSQSFPTKPHSNSVPTFSHEKPAQQHHQQIISSTQPKSAQFSMPTRQQLLPQPAQQQQTGAGQQEPRTFNFFDSQRTSEFSAVDGNFIGPQPPMATVVEQPNKDLYNPFRTEDLPDGQRNEALGTGSFSTDILASLHVPSGHSESISPTAAFLHTFPLVSAGRNTHEENAERVEGAGSNLLQLGTLEENNQPMELNSLIPGLEDKNKRIKGFTEELLLQSYHIESEYDAEISSIMSSNSAKPRQQSKNGQPQQQRQQIFQQQDYATSKNKQNNFEFYQQQQQFKKRTVGAAQKPPLKESRQREQSHSTFKSNQSYPNYSAANYQTASAAEPSASTPALATPINNFMPWNNPEGQQPQRSAQQNYSCRQPSQQHLQKEVQRPPVNWMTSDVRHDEGAVNIFDFDWNKQTPLPTLVGDLALGPNPPTPRKKDSACKYNAGQNFLSVSQLVEMPKEKAKRRLVTKAGNGPKRVERTQKQNQQPCIDYHSVTNWPAPKPVCKSVPSSYSAEALIGPPQQEQIDKTENHRYNQRFTRNYHAGEQNFFPAEQQLEYHQASQYDCSSMYQHQPNTTFASIVTSASSTTPIVSTFNQDLNLFPLSTPNARSEHSKTNSKRRGDFNGYSDCNRTARPSGSQQYQQQPRPNQQINVPPSAPSGSSLTNFNLSTIFPEINKPVIATPLAPFIAPNPKGQSGASDYVIPPPPVSFNNLLAPTPPQVSFPAPNFMPSGLQFPAQHDT